MKILQRFKLNTYIESDFQTNSDFDGIRTLVGPLKRLQWPKRMSLIRAQATLALIQAM